VKPITINNFFNYLSSALKAQFPAQSVSRQSSNSIRKERIRALTAAAKRNRRAERRALKKLRASKSTLGEELKRPRENPLP
jgi:hypothetical protein